MIIHLKTTYSRPFNFWLFVFNVFFIYGVTLISVIFSVRHFTSCLTHCCFFVSVFYSIFLFVHDIMLTSVIFSVHHFTSRLTRFFILYFFINILVICISVRMNVPFLIPLLIKGNNTAFIRSSVRTTDDVDYPRCLSIHWWILRHYTL